jgi:ferric-dicitrate binding protein FerR (iron transport regulator)
MLAEFVMRLRRDWLRRWSLFCGCVLLSCLAGNAVAQVGAGTIKDLQGAAAVHRNGGSIVAASGMPLLLGDKILTSLKSRVTVELIDGSELTLSEGSSIVIERAMTSVADSMIELFKGRLRSLVNMVPGKATGFEVHTPNAVASVRGTDFDVEYIEGKPCPGFPQCLRYTDVGVYKGTVEVHNPTSLKPTAVRVAAGYETTVPCELPPAAPGPLGIGNLIGPGYH